MEDVCAMKETFVPPGWRLAERNDNARAMLSSGMYRFGAECVTFIDGSSLDTGTGQSCEIPDSDPPYLNYTYEGKV